jgi:hypothetical protein
MRFVSRCIRVKDIKASFPDAIIREVIIYNIDGENAMPTNGIAASIQVFTKSLSFRRGKIFLSGLALRLLIALIVSWFIVMAFFVTGAISH